MEEEITVFQRGQEHGRFEERQLAEKQRSNKGSNRQEFRKMRDEGLKAGIGFLWTVEVIFLTALKGKNMVVLFLDTIITFKALSVSCFFQTYFSLMSIDISAFHPTLQTLIK